MEGKSSGLLSKKVQTVRICGKVFKKFPCMECGEMTTIPMRESRATCDSCWGSDHALIFRARNKGRPCVGIVRGLRETPSPARLGRGILESLPTGKTRQGEQHSWSAVAKSLNIGGIANDAPPRWSRQPLFFLRETRQMMNDPQCPKCQTPFKRHETDGRKVYCAVCKDEMKPATEILNINIEIKELEAQIDEQTKELTRALAQQHHLKLRWLDRDWET